MLTLHSMCTLNGHLMQTHAATKSNTEELSSDESSCLLCIVGMDLLHYACRGMLDEVRQLIRRGTSVNVVNGDGQSALYFACEHGHYDVAKFLLENKALVSYKAKPLIVAARNGHAACVELLLKHGADVYCRNRNKQTAMDVAVQKMHVSVILSLVDYGVRPRIPEITLFQYAEGEDAKMFCKMLNSGSLSIKSDESLVAALQFAFKHHSLEMASYLLSSHLRSNVEQVHALALYHSARNNWCDILTDLLKKVTNVNTMTESCTPLCAACDHCSDEVVHLLLQHGANPNILCKDPQRTCETSRESLLSKTQNYRKNRVRSDLPLTSGITVDMSPLFVACRRGDLAIVKTLLSWGADPNLATFEHHPLSIACSRRHHEIVKLLLEHGANVHVFDKFNVFPLHHALFAVSAAESNPDLSTVNLLLDYGADTNAMIIDDKTPLYIASSKGLTAAVQRLLKCGAKLDVSKDKKSPLIVACECDHMAVVELLLTEGADPNMPQQIPDQDSFALHVAAAGQKEELVTLLLNHGANINIADAFGNTALHRAIYCSDLVYIHCQKVVDTLLCAGADVNISNNKGETSLYLTVKKGLTVNKGFLGLVDSMLSHGGNLNVAACDEYLFRRACEKQNVKLVEMLLKAGADPNPVAVHSSKKLGCELPLCIAAKCCNYELATLLLNHGAKVNMLNSAGESALYLALKGSFADDCFHRPRLDKLKNVKCVIKLLLEYGADVNQYCGGLSPLQQLLDNSYCFDWSLVTTRSFFQDLMHILICNGAHLADSSSWVLVEQRHVNILYSLCGWFTTDQMSVELLKSGAGFTLLALYCRENSAAGLDRVKSIHLCQAAVMAGYVASAEELEELQQLVTLSGGRVSPGGVELLSWLVEDRQQAPSLMRQCRVAIRRQLTVASCHRTILPAIDQLPLPRCMQQYLKFEGSRAEVDLEADGDAEEETDTEGASTVSDDLSDIDESEYIDDSDWSDDDIERF